MVKRAGNSTTKVTAAVGQRVDVDSPTIDPYKVLSQLKEYGVSEALVVLGRFPPPVYSASQSNARAGGGLRRKTRLFGRLLFADCTFRFS